MLTWNLFKPFKISNLGKTRLRIWLNSVCLWVASVCVKPIKFWSSITALSSYTNCFSMNLDFLRFCFWILTWSIFVTMADMLLPIILALMIWPGTNILVVKNESSGRTGKCPKVLIEIML